VGGEREGDGGGGGGVGGKFLRGLELVVGAAGEVCWMGVLDAGKCSIRLGRACG